MPPVAAREALYAEPTTAFVNDVVEMATGATTTIVRLLVAVIAVGVVESVTVTDTVLLPAAVGVPVMAPVDAFTVRPAGSPVAAHLYGELPPVAPREAL